MSHITCGFRGYILSCQGSLAPPIEKTSNSSKHNCCSNSDRGNDKNAGSCSLFFPRLKCSIGLQGSWCYSGVVFTISWAFPIFAVAISTRFSIPAVVAIPAAVVAIPAAVVAITAVVAISAFVAISIATLCTTQTPGLNHQNTLPKSSTTMPTTTHPDFTQP
jgi:hypothetical protein